MQYRDAILASLPYTKQIEIADLQGSTEETVYFLRDLILSYGILLREWQHVRESAVLLRHQGCTLAERVL
jgi:hypothetical protein